MSGVVSARKVARSVITTMKGTGSEDPREAFQRKSKYNFSTASLFATELLGSEIPTSKLKERRNREFRFLRYIDTMVGLYMPKKMNRWLIWTLYISRGLVLLLFPIIMIVIPFDCPIYKEYTENQTKDEVSVWDSQFLSKLAAFLPFLLWFLWHFGGYAATPIWKHAEVWDFEPTWGSQMGSFDVEILSRDQFATVFKHIRWSRYLMEYMMIWCLSLCFANSWSTFTIAEDDFSKNQVAWIVWFEFITTLSHFFAFVVMIQFLFHIMVYFNLFKHSTHHLRKVLDSALGVDIGTLRDGDSIRSVRLGSIRSDRMNSIRSDLGEKHEQQDAYDSVESLWKTGEFIFILVLWIWLAMLVVVMGVAFENAPLTYVFAYTLFTLLLFFLILIIYMIVKCCWLQQTTMYQGEPREFCQVMSGLLIFSILTPFLFSPYVQYVIHWTLLGFTITVVWLVFFLSNLFTFLYSVVMGTVHPELPNVTVLLAGMLTGEKLTSKEKRNLVKNLMSATEILKDGKDFAKDVFMENKMLDVADDKMVKLTRKLRDMTKGLSHSQSVEKFKKSMDMVVSIQAVSGTRSIKKNLKDIMNKLTKHINKHVELAKDIDTDSIVRASTLFINLDDDDNELPRNELEERTEEIMKICLSAVEDLRKTSMPKILLEEVEEDVSIIRNGFKYWQMLDNFKTSPIEDTIEQIDQSPIVNVISANAHIDLNYVHQGFSTIRQSVLQVKEVEKRFRSNTTPGSAPNFIEIVGEYANSAKRVAHTLISDELPDIQIPNTSNAAVASFEDIASSTTIPAAPLILNTMSSLLTPQSAEDFTRKKDLLSRGIQHVRKVSKDLGHIKKIVDNDIHQSFKSEGTIRVDRLVEKGQNMVQNVNSLKEIAQDLDVPISGLKDIKTGDTDSNVLVTAEDILSSEKRKPEG